MSSKATHIRPWGWSLFAVLLPFPLVLVWCLHDSLAFVQNTTDSGVGLHWPASESTLNLRVGCPPNNPLTEYGPCWDDAARDAAERWNVVGAKFRFRIQSPSRPVDPCGGQDGLTTVVWADTVCGEAFGDETLAVTSNWFQTTGELVDSDVLFNTNKDWTTYSGPQRSHAIDFHRVAIHEFGHVLGLDHPDDHGQFVDAIMNSKADDIDRLQADDIAGIRAIYSGDASRGQPDPDYCRDFGPCPAGKGDCDSNSECQSGLTCVNDVGARYGLPAHYDVCEASSRPDPDYCVRNYCGIGDGDCDPGQCDEGVCVNDVGARYGLPAHYDVCEARGGPAPDPDYCVYNYCGLGDGDCDPGQCDEGVCVNDVGARYGLPAHYDVCEARGSGSSLNDLLGTWRFRYTIISTFTSIYRLSRVDTSTGTPHIVGTDEYGDPVIAGRIQDINPGNPLPYEFALLDPSDFLICQFFVFNKTGNNSVEGFYFQIDVRNGVCGTDVSDISNPYPMTGTRTSRSTLSIQEQSTPRDTVLGQPNAELQSLEETTTLSLPSHDEEDSAAIRDMINILSSTLD